MQGMRPLQSGMTANLAKEDGSNVGSVEARCKVLDEEAFFAAETFTLAWG